MEHPIVILPKTLKAALKDLEVLRKEYNAESERRSGYYDSYMNEKSARVAAQTERDETRSQFADLKERLLNAETELSRLRGYLARVHEDDVVRDGLVEIEDGQGKRSVPRRQPPFTMQVSEPYHSPILTTYDNYGREQKRTHWTSY